MNPRIIRTMLLSLLCMATGIGRPGRLDGSGPHLPQGRPGHRMRRKGPHRTPQTRAGCQTAAPGLLRRRIGQPSVYNGFRERERLRALIRLAGLFFGGRMKREMSFWVWAVWHRIRQQALLPRTGYPNGIRPPVCRPCGVRAGTRRCSHSRAAARFSFPKRCCGSATETGVSASHGRRRRLPGNSVQRHNLRTHPGPASNSFRRGAGLRRKGGKPDYSIA